MASAEHSAPSRSSNVLFVRCARIATPIRLEISGPFDGTTVSQLKQLFLAAAEGQLPPLTSNNMQRTCRMIARGREMTDGCTLASFNLDSGDHLHAIVTEVSGPSPQQQAAAPAGGARQWLLRSVERIGAESRRMVALDGGNGGGGGGGGDGAAGGGGAQQRVMRLVDELMIPSGGNNNANAAAAGAAAANLPPVGADAAAAEDDRLFIVGALLGLFIGFPSLMTLAMDGPFPKLRIGCVFGIAVNVILATLLSSPMHVPVRHEG